LLGLLLTLLPNQFIIVLQYPSYSIDDKFMPQVPAQTSRQFLYFLMFTALICGGLIMVIEVLGSRVIGPFFGVSLFIWTSLIAVTLISLALGYGVGGMLADRRGAPEYLYGIIIMAGVLVVLIPLIRAFILELCIPLGLRLGSFTSTSLLFGPSLFLLGCVSPYLIKVATIELTNLGKTVGGFYALSTIGSVIGTSITGFFLIAYLSVDTILLLVGSLLILLGISFFVFFRRNYGAIVVLLVPLIVSTQSNESNLSRIAADGTQVNLVKSENSYYGSIQVVDYRYGDQALRELMIDGLIQGGVDMESGLSVYEYTYFLQFLPYAINPRGRSCLVIGLGAGIIPRWYEQVGITTDVVDIDPKIFAIAKQYFGLNLSGNQYVQDARYFLRSTTASYDYIILDVFNGDTTPSHLLSLEALQLTKNRLNHRGILGINLVGSLDREPFMTASVIKTLKEIFDQVEIYPTFDMKGTELNGNLTVIAYSGPAVSPDYSVLERFSIHPLAKPMVIANLQTSVALDQAVEAIVLTDAYNPIDFFDSWLRESVRDKILSGTELDILLHSG
jgi:spermidine synthase